MIIEGKALKYSDNIDTDVIYPGKYLVYTEPSDVARYALTGLDPKFPEKIKEFGLIVAGKNFGCGSSREHARIFYRNAVNIGLPVLECKSIAQEVSEGDHLRISLEKGVIENLTNKKILYAKPMPEFLLNIFKYGGLIEYVNAKG
ncbi:MAG: 3-isopropylmalate dehydratase [Candidatus Bathyarchaeia archaeon]